MTSRVLLCRRALSLSATTAAQKLKEFAWLQVCMAAHIDLNYDGYPQEYPNGSLTLSRVPVPNLYP